ncbi:MAG: methionine sulfoxide reductase heme-binding subunit [Solirubrobacteraceae bacterium]|nr:methionine sulfoxide reductase heme-binding subunit [Solirubrobacteraceae bacterium]
MIAATGPSALWYLARGTGAVTLVLLSLSVILGITGTLRRQPTSRVPRFLVDGLHRNVSLLVLVLLAAHILTSVLDPFAHIHLLDAVIPLHSSYRPLWLGFGALAFDLLLALTITSVLRRRLGLRVWKAVHWAAYACWPVAVLHGLGTGSDAKAGWLQALTAVCVLGVVAAIGARLAGGWPADARRRLGGAAVVVGSLCGLVAFALAGPLQAGWAQRAGTPAPLLATTAPSTAALRLPLSARVDGTLQRSTRADGSSQIDIVATLRGSGADAHVTVALKGQRLSSGGLQLASSSVTLGSAATPRLYTGTVAQLGGADLVATLHGADGTPVSLRLSLSIPAGSTRVGGTATARLA